MTDSLIAGGDQIPAQQPKNFYEELVGDGKKFKSNEDLARGKWEADEFIRTKNKAFDDLSADYVKLREQFSAAQNLQQLADRLEQLQKNTPSSDPNLTANVDNNKTAINPDQMRSLAREEFSALEAARQEANNYRVVQEKLKERFGNNYPNILKSEMERLGMSEKSTNDLARQNPALFYRAFGLDTVNPENFQTPPVSNDRKGFGQQTQKRTWSYYQEMKRNDPKRYADPKTHIQMHKDYQALGAEFEDGDFTA